MMIDLTVTAGDLYHPDLIASITGDDERDLAQKIGTIIHERVTNEKYHRKYAYNCDTLHFVKGRDRVVIDYGGILDFVVIDKVPAINSQGFSNLVNTYLFVQNENMICNLANLYINLYLYLKGEFGYLRNFEINNLNWYDFNGES